MKGALELPRDQCRLQFSRSQEISALTPNQDISCMTRLQLNQREKILVKSLLLWFLAREIRSSPTQLKYYCGNTANRPVQVPSFNRRSHEIFSWVHQSSHMRKNKSCLDHKLRRRNYKLNYMVLQARSTANFHRKEVGTVRWKGSKHAYELTKLWH